MHHVNYHCGLTVSIEAVSLTWPSILQNAQNTGFQIEDRPILKNLPKSTSSQVLTARPWHL